MKIDKIKSIKKIELTSKRYDIEVENVHNFFANNILVHNCQNMEWILETHKNVPFYATEKLDGTSFTAYLKDGEFGICSRNLEMKETETSAYWIVARQLDLENKMRKFSNENNNINFALQGEMVGEGIQKNIYGLTGKTVYFFNIFNSDTHDYFTFNDFVSTINTMGLKTVPIVDNNFKLLSSVDKMLKFADGKSLLNKSANREGLVFRPLGNIYNENGNKLSFKVISNKYLLKNGG